MIAVSDNRVYHQEWPDISSPRAGLNNPAWLTPPSAGRSRVSGISSMCEDSFAEDIISSSTPIEFAGIRLTPMILERVKESRKMCSAIVNLASDACVENASSSAFITRETAISALAFLNLWPNFMPLPKLLPDGEGDLIFLWENSDATKIILTIEGKLLHLVVRALNSGTQYLDEVPFFRDEIPGEIMRQLVASIT